MDSWLQLTEAEFSTWHTFNPRGLCHWILLDKIHPGESCPSKEQGICVPTAGIKGCCTPGSHYTCVCSCFQQEDETHRRCWLTLRGFRTSTQPEQSSKPASLSWWQHPMQLLPSPSNKVLWSFSIPPALPRMNEISPECLLLILLLRKYFNGIYDDEWIHCTHLWMGKWRYRELQWFNNLRNECRFADSHSSDTGKVKKHQKQPKPPGCFTFYSFPVMSEKL